MDVRFHLKELNLTEMFTGFEEIKGDHEDGSYFLEFQKDLQTSLSMQCSDFSKKSWNLLYGNWLCLPNTSVHDFLVKRKGKPNLGSVWLKLNTRITSLTVQSFHISPKSHSPEMSSV